MSTPAILLAFHFLSVTSALADNNPGCKGISTKEFGDLQSDLQARRKQYTDYCTESSPLRAEAQAAYLPAIACDKLKIDTDKPLKVYQRYLEACHILARAVSSEEDLCSAVGQTVYDTEQADKAGAEAKSARDQKAAFDSIAAMDRDLQRKYAELGLRAQVGSRPVGKGFAPYPEVAQFYSAAGNGQQADLEMRKLANAAIQWAQTILPSASTGGTIGAAPARDALNQCRQLYKSAGQPIRQFEKDYQAQLAKTLLDVDREMSALHDQFAALREKYRAAELEAERHADRLGAEQLSQSTIVIPKGK